MSNGQEDRYMAKKGKEIRDVKGEEPKKDDKIQVIAGNIPILTVQMLNSINVSLLAIRRILEEDNG